MSCSKETTAYHQVLCVWVSSALGQRHNKVHFPLSCFVCFPCVQGSCPRHWQGHGALLGAGWWPTPWSKSPGSLLPSEQPLKTVLACCGCSFGVTFGLQTRQRKSHIALVCWAHPWVQRELTQQMPESSGHGLSVRGRSGFLTDLYPHQGIP